MHNATIFNRSVALTLEGIPYGATGYGLGQGPFGVGQRGQRIVRGIINATFIDDQDRAYQEQVNRSEAFRGF